MSRRNSETSLASMISFVDTDHGKDVNRKKILKGMSSKDSDRRGVKVVVGTSNFGLTSTSRALYAKLVNNGCIIFMDIVGFSRIALHMKPIEVMDMLQDLFSRFDSLCDTHSVHKLETVGEATFVPWA